MGASSFQKIETKGKELGADPAENNSKEISPFALLEKLRALPIWCYNNTKHIDNPDYINDYCCITHVVGLPKHAATREEEPLAPFQIEFIEEVIRIVSKPGNMSEKDHKRLSHMFHILKGRQMGFTEIVLRLIQYFCLNRYAGKKVGIIAATSGELAKKDLRRFYRLFHNIKPLIKVAVTSTKIILINDTEIEAFKANEEALTGDTDYACIFMDESAKWKLVEDRPVFNSIMPIVRSNGADLFLVSTGKGPIKMFYRIYLDPEEFIKFEYNILRTVGNMYTQEQVDGMLASTQEDPDQEYMCKFTVGKDSILGAVTKQDRDDNNVEWGQEGTNLNDPDEDDNYEETDEEKNEEW